MATHPPDSSSNPFNALSIESTDQQKRRDRNKYRRRNKRRNARSDVLPTPAHDGHDDSAGSPERAQVSSRAESVYSADVNRDGSLSRAAAVMSSPTAPVDGSSTTGSYTTAKESNRSSDNGDIFFETIEKQVPLSTATRQLESENSNHSSDEDEVSYKTTEKQIPSWDRLRHSKSAGSDMSSSNESYDGSASISKDDLACRQRNQTAPASSQASTARKSSSEEDSPRKSEKVKPLFVLPSSLLSSYKDVTSKSSRPQGGGIATRLRSSSKRADSLTGSHTQRKRPRLTPRIGEEGGMKVISDIERRLEVMVKDMAALRDNDKTSVRRKS